MKHFILMCTFFLFVAGFSAFAQTIEDKIKHAAINSTVWDDGFNQWFVVRKKAVGTDSVAMLVGGIHFKVEGGTPLAAFSTSSSVNNYTNSNVRVQLATLVYSWLEDDIKTRALIPVLGNNFSLDVTTEPLEPLQVGNANQDVLFCLSYRDAVNWEANFSDFWHPNTFGVGAYSRWWLRTGYSYDGSAQAYEALFQLGVWAHNNVLGFEPSIRPAVWVKYGTSGFTISGTVSGLQDNVGITVYYTVNSGAQQSVTTTANGAYIINNIPSGANVVITASNQTGYVGTVSPTPATDNVTDVIIGKDIEYVKTGFTVNDESYIDVDGKVFCDTSDFVFVAYPDTLTNIVWTLNGTVIASGDESTINVNGLADGYYTVNMIANNANHITNFYVGKGAVAWNGSDVNTALIYWQDSIAPSLESATGISTENYMYNWYESNGTTPYAGAGNLINTNTVGLQTYFVSRTNGMCESEKIKVNVLIIAAQAPSYTACPGENVTLGVETVNDVNYYWYSSETGGTALSEFSSNTCTTVTDVVLPQTFWVEPRVGTTVFARIPITVTKDPNCIFEPSECMTEGTLLFKEDFGGNNASDLGISPTGLPSGFSQLPYQTASGITDGFYSLVKNPTLLLADEFHNINDHTNPNDNTRGYFMFVNPGNNDIDKILYQTNINNLCDDMKLSFSAWFMNLNVNENDGTLNVVLPKIRMEMLNNTMSHPEYGNILTSTGDITLPYGTEWLQNGFDFKLPAGVTDVSFRIINRENSSAGNNWGLDDIEIRFCAPPVFVPFEEITECEKSPITLSGSYEDNGTFGNNLVYRWERSSTGNINNPAEWSVVFGSEKSVSDGKVASSHTITGKAGYYRLVVSSPSKINTWACRAASKIVELKVLTIGSSLVWTPEANAGNDKQNWNNPDNWTPAVRPSACHIVYIPGNSSHYPVLTDDEKGVCGDIYFIQGAELGRPDLLIYERAYIQYNFGLWKESQITNKDDPNLMLTNSSTSNRMQYSASTSTPLSRERWYILSSPLQGVVTGDLGFGGFPLTFLKKFDPVKRANQNYSVGNWTTTYTSMIEPITSSMTDGFAFYMYGYDPAGNADRNFGCEESGSFNNSAYNDLSYLPTVRNGERYGIEKTNGILELPFFADSDSTGLYAHRTQVYNSTSNESTFYAVNDGINSLANFNKLTGTSVSISREPNGGNYRFATEEYNSGNKKWEFQPQIYHTVTGLSNGDEILLGNPYMSSIDMVKFCQDNISSIHSSFRIWDGVGFVDYSVNTATGEVTSSIGSYAATDRFVAPLQGFVVASTGKGNILFDVTNVSTVRPSEASSNLRSAVESVEYNTLRIKAENDVAVSDAVIKYNEDASNTFMRGKDMQKLFSPNNYVPEIYSLAGEIPSSIQFINNNGEIIIPLGIRTSRRAELNLTFTGMDNYVEASKIELIDAQENLTVDLTGKSSYTYTFNHTDAGVSNGRFSVRFQNSMTSLSEVPASDDLKVYGDSQGIYVISSESDPIQQVIVYDFQGRSVYESKSGAKFYPMQRNFMNSPLIVKVITKNGTKTAKLVING